MKSTAPAFTARTAIGTSACPVTTIVGNPAPRRTSSACRSSPLMPGMRTSRTRHPVCVGSYSRRKSAALAYVRTVNPTDSSRQRSDSRIARSSSTTKTIGSGGIASPLRRRQQHVERGAARRVRGDPELSAMDLDDRPADRKPEAHAVLLGGEEGLEQPRRRALRQATSGIAHDQLDGGAGASDRLDRKLARRAVAGAHRLEPVANQVEDHLLELDGVDLHLERRVTEREAQRDALLARLDLGEVNRVADEHVQVRAPASRLGVADELADAAEDLAGPQRLVGDRVDHAEQRGRIDVAATGAPHAADGRG